VIFKRPRNTLEGLARPVRPGEAETAGERSCACPQCKKTIMSSELFETLNVCPYCRYHFRLNARQRLRMMCDEGSFEEHDRGMKSANPISFPDYDKKLEHARLESAENDAVVCGEARIMGHRTGLFVMEPGFMMGSMGSVVGEKITRLFEHAAENSLPVVGFTVSGGARMQEGILSLMQMAKTSGAVKRHSDMGLLYVCVLCDPTTGGVSASIANEADIIAAEPGALIGFAGPRVIEQTIRRKLPEGFQTAEFQLAHGFVDTIQDRVGQRAFLASVLAMHERGENP